MFSASDPPFSIISFILSKQSSFSKKLLCFVIILTSYCVLSQLFFVSKLLPQGSLSNSTSNSFPPKATQSEKDEELDFWVHRYLRWHKSNRHNASRVVVFLPVKAGLGDNVIGMINLWGYAVVTKRLFLIDFKKPYPLSPLLNERARYEFIYREDRDSAFGKKHGIRMRVPVKSKMYNGTANLLKGRTPVVALHLSISDRPDLFAERPPNYQGYVPKFSYEVKRAITRILLEPSNEILKEKNKFLARHKMDDGRPYFGFHARLGRGVGESHNPRFSKIDFEAIARCNAERMRRIGESHGIDRANLRVFIATDTPDFRIVFKKAMHKIVSGSKVIAMNNDVSHFTKSTAHSSQVQMHVENIILGDALEIVAFRSGFSVVAAYRGSTKKLHQTLYNWCPKMEKK